MRRYFNRRLGQGLTFLVSLAAAAACSDQPTALQVRDAVEKADHDLFARNGQLTSDLQRSITYALERTKVFPSSLLEVERDGTPLRFVATVMERVYLPPPTSGAAPYTRRMLMAWDPEAQRGIAVSADDSVANVVFPSPETLDEQSPARLWGHVGFVTQLEHDGRDGWFGAEGSVALEIGPATGGCKIRSPGEALGFPYLEHSPKSRDACQEVLYHVSAATMLEHRDPVAGRGVLDRWTTSKMTLRIPAQDVPGTRIITQCPEYDGKTAPAIVGCMNYYNFWRAQAQFDPTLGVNLERVRKTTRPGFYYQPWIAGSGPAFTCCREFGGAVRYTVRRANGDVVRHVDSTRASKDSVLSLVQGVGGALREGSRSLLFVPARYFERSASDFAVYVLDVSVLPCGAGMKRFDTPFPGAPQPDGGCYPAKNFPRSP